MASTAPAPSSSATPGKVLASATPGSFQRVTTKFWVPLDRLETVKARIAKNIPIYRFDKSLPVPAYTNSVYMDSTDLSCYYNRLRRVEDAFLIRLRWYQSDYNKIFVERKVHHESWGGEVSVKSRFTCHAADVPRFLSGEYELETHLTHIGEFREQVDQVTELFNEFREKIRSTRLFPILRTKYARTAFQYTPHVDCRASLDEDLQMLLEPCEPGQFRRAESTPISESMILRFPYAVFELKVENPEAFPDAWPDWVQEMVEDGSFIEVYKYSKFLTGIAWLLPERTTVNPGWLPLVSEKVRIIDPYHQRIGNIPKGSHLTTEVLNSDGTISNLGKMLLDTDQGVTVDILTTKKDVKKEGVKEKLDDLSTPLLDPASRTVTPASTLTRADITPPHNQTALGFYNNVNDAIANTTFPAFPPHLFEGKPMLIPMKVEPKVYFANERTMLHWVKFGAKIGMLGAFVIEVMPIVGNGEQDKVLGLLLSGIGIVMMLYGLFMYRIRLGRIMMRVRGPYYDRIGPVFLVIAFTIFLVVRMFIDAFANPYINIIPC